MNTTPQYNSGEPIKQGDRVLIGNWSGKVEFIVTTESPQWEEYWKYLGEGIMFEGPAFGHLFTKFNDEDVVFVGRKKDRR